MIERIDEGLIEWMSYWMIESINNCVNELLCVLLRVLLRMCMLGFEDAWRCLCLCLCLGLCLCLCACSHACALVSTAMSSSLPPSPSISTPHRCPPHTYLKTKTTFSGRRCTGHEYLMGGNCQVRENPTDCRSWCCWQLGVFGKRSSQSHNLARFKEFVTSQCR